ncbi:MAG: 30S ribosomal protein S17 [Candidatus Babeliaceae bacterium]|nr:30S ribosomal protein S17 [Candidatus Babeliaceae bacterium]
MKKVQRTLVGVVVSDKMDKTIVVKVERTYVHPRLRKVVRTDKTYKVHDEESVARVGDSVEICEGRPVSKTKYMYLRRVLSSPSAAVEPHLA